MQRPCQYQTIIQLPISQKISCIPTLKTHGLCSMGTANCLTLFFSKHMFKNECSRDKNSFSSYSLIFLIQGFWRGLHSTARKKNEGEGFFCNRGQAFFQILLRVLNFLKVSCSLPHFTHTQLGVWF